MAQPASCCLAAPTWGPGGCGGISLPPTSSASSRRRPTGRPAAFRRCPGTPNSSHCPSAARATCAIPELPSPFIEPKQAGDRLRVGDAAVADHRHRFGERHYERLEELAGVQLAGAQGQLFGKEQLYGLVR